MKIIFITLIFKQLQKQKSLYKYNYLKINALTQLLYLLL